MHDGLLRHREVKFNSLIASAILNTYYINKDHNLVLATSTSLYARYKYLHLTQWSACLHKDIRF